MTILCRGSMLVREKAGQVGASRYLLSLSEIRHWFDCRARRRRLGELVPPISEIAKSAGISRQTVYAVLRNERGEFSEVAQIRLSRVIQQISADPAYRHTRLMSVDLGGGTLRLRFGGQP
jgi:hypothetical protein